MTSESFQVKKHLTMNMFTALIIPWSSVSRPEPLMRIVFPGLSKREYTVCFSGPAWEQLNKSFENPQVLHLVVWQRKEAVAQWYSIHFTCRRSSIQFFASLVKKHDVVDDMKDL